MGISSEGNKRLTDGLILLRKIYVPNFVLEQLDIDAITAFKATARNDELNVNRRKGCHLLNKIV